MNLNLIAEHIVDPESAKAFLRNLGILPASPPICNICGQKNKAKKKWARRFNHKAMPKAENFDYKREFS